MIDDDGYRPNVGIVICNRQGQAGVEERQLTQTFRQNFIFELGHIGEGFEARPETPAQISDNSLAKAIFTSRKLFSVSLHISAVRELVTTHSPSRKILYSSLARAEQTGVPVRQKQEWN